MHGLMGGGWRRSVGHGHRDGTARRETTGTQGLGTYRRTTPPRQSPTLHGRFYRSRLYPLLKRINTYLMRWAGQKYRRLRSYQRFKSWWFGIIDREPELFTHWRWVRTFAGLR
jgi:hypothetical protein